MVAEQIEFTFVQAGVEGLGRPLASSAVALSSITCRQPLRAPACPNARDQAAESSLERSLRQTLIIEECLSPDSLTVPDDQPGAIIRMGKALLRLLRV
jgi:hypothetical protein